MFLHQSVWFLTVFAVITVRGAVKSSALVCYLEGESQELEECTHVVYTGEARGDKLDGLLKVYRKDNAKAKLMLRVNHEEKDFNTILKSKYIQGLEVHDVHKSLNRTKVVETLETAKAALSKHKDMALFLALPSHPELLAKYYDLRALVKIADLMMVQTHALGLVKKMTYHPSRLSGLWDMMNTDSVVDLVVGLGVHPSKIVISLPASARKFTLQNATLSTPGSPTLDDQPQEISQSELCELLKEGRWTLERDQDLSAPYAFKNTTWVSFEDASSVDVKGKYARVRGLGGLALHRAELDNFNSCGTSLRFALAKVLNSQARAPRGAILRSLEQDILSSQVGHVQALDALQLSPYRITQVVDSDGVIHSIREDTRTEFSCSRQGYFVHPRSCARFYRCVKFDQLSSEYTVFEFDCPAGLAFDSRYEVCVWPGSLPHSQACPGSSEIAPVPQTRFVCPAHEGYYADPENCRWFFACLDHGKSPLSAYEFRCPFGLGFDEQKLKCDWPWLVPACGHIARYEAEVHGYSGAVLTGAAGFQGQTADSINIAAHQSLASGASLNNLVGIQSGFLSQADQIDSNYIASQELVDAGHLPNNQFVGQSGLGYHELSGSSFVDTTNYNDDKKYTSGGILLDDYRLPANSKLVGKTNYNSALSQGQVNSYKINAQVNTDYQDNSGAYVHDSTGDHAVPYKHIDLPAVPYIHDDKIYKDQNDYNDYIKYQGSVEHNLNEKYENGNNGQYINDNSGQYYHSDSNLNGAFGARYGGEYKKENTGSYEHDNSGAYIAGIYQGNDGHYTGLIEGADKYSHSSVSNQNFNSYLNAPEGQYGSENKVYNGGVNVDLVGKTTLVESGNNDNIDNYKYHNQNTYGSIKSQSLNHGVSITHLGSEVSSFNDHNLGYVTEPTSSGIPTTATPIAVTTAIPVITYKTTYVQESPKSSVKEIFGYSPHPVSHVQPTVLPIKQYVTPKVQITDYNQAADFQNYSQQNIGLGITEATVTTSTGYDYPKPNVKFDDGINTHTTAAPVVKESGYEYTKPTVNIQEGINIHSSIIPTYQQTPEPHVYSHQTIHFDQPAVEEPFRNVVAYSTGVPSITAYLQPTVSQPNVYSHQTIHKVETSNDNSYSSNIDSVKNSYDYPKPNIELPETPIVNTTPQPKIQFQHLITSTYKPQIFSHQTFHNTENNYNTYASSGTGNAKETSGYFYQKPVVNFEENPKTYFEYSTPQPPVTITQSIAPDYKSHAYSQQTIHKVEHPVPVLSTPRPFVQVKYEQPAITVYQNPLVQYTNKVTPAVTYEKPTEIVYTQPFNVQQHEVKHISYQSQPNENLNYQFSEQYSIPKIQQNLNIVNSGLSYNQAHATSHQVYHQTAVKSNSYEKKNKDVVFVSTTPSQLIYEDHYAEYDVSSKANSYKAPEYIPPKKELLQSTFDTSSPIPSVIYEHKYQASDYIPPKQEIVQHYAAVTTPSPKVVYEHHYEAPEYVPPKQEYVEVSTTAPQVFNEQHYKAPEYIQSKNDYIQSYAPVSTEAPVLIQHQYFGGETYSQNNAEQYAYINQQSKPIHKVSFSTTHEQPKQIINSYPQQTVTSTNKPFLYETPEIQIGYKAEEYLPPVVSTSKPATTTFKAQTYIPPTTREYSPPSVTNFNAPEYLPPKVDTTYLPPSTTVRPVIMKSTPVYKAPEYLPPDFEGHSNFENFGLRENVNINNKFQEFSFENQPIVVSTTAFPSERKHNLVVDTSKSNLLGFGTVGPDAGLVSSTPYAGTSSAASSTYAPIKQEFVEITPSPIPVRKIKPKVSVVTKLNDFNPLLVRKLGAVCSCQSPVLILKGKRPNVRVQQDYDYTSNDYDDSDRGDIGNYEFGQKQIDKFGDLITKQPAVTSSVNPIIVQEEYPDYSESRGKFGESGKKIYSDSFVSSTPVPVSSTERIVKISPRYKAVTVAPTIKTVLVNEAVTPYDIVLNDSAGTINAQSFDRYGPGGWRSRDETLQGTVDCQRAGLFRHPKQCNKFYSCRWDTTKQRFTLHVFNCPVQLSFDPSLGACNWPSQGPACQGNTLLTNAL